MHAKRTDQGTITELNTSYYLLTWLEAFILDRKVRGLSAETIKWYKKKLTPFARWCDDQVVTQVDQITPDVLRRYLVVLEERGHNPGGIHSIYRAIRAFLRWWGDEVEPEGWRNPTERVKAPKVPNEPIEPVELDTVRAMMDNCGRDFHGFRDKAIMLALLDTGARAGELLAMNLDDVDPITGEILIRRGKGSKSRMVYLGKQSRKALRAYLKHRSDTSPAVWTSDTGERLSYSGLRSIIRRRSMKAGVDAPKLHDFRRFFALTMLRNGTDIFTLQKLMGHADLQVLRRYLAQTNQDTLEAHRRAGPVDSVDI